MSATRYYYLSDKIFNSSGEVDSMFFTESSSNNPNNENNKTTEGEKDYEESELMPYTPNSADRSSVGSIPWADDAIKQNQLDWERIERMLAGLEKPQTDEVELNQEILEWQQKFPHFINTRNSQSKFNLQQSFDSSRTNMDASLNIDTLSNDSLEYSDNELEDGLATPTMKNYINQKQRKTSVTDLAQQLSRNLRISSVPLTWRQRHNHITDFTRNIREQSEFSSTSPAISPPPRPPPRRLSPTYNSLIIAPTKPKLSAIANKMKPKQAYNLMPPLLNVLESKRRFRGLSNNQSFVQLTHLQQTKSAALTQQSANRSSRRNQQTAWHVPLAAANIGKRFLSNRNSVVLPALNLRRINEHRTTTDAPSSASSVSSFTEGGLLSLQNYKQYVQQEPAYYLQQQYANGFSSTTPSTSGRSISAAVHHPRIELSAFYLPYSAATKFKSFNKI